MASNSRPSSSSCSALSRASGLSISAGMLDLLRRSESDLDRPLGGVDAGPDDLARAARHLPRAQIANLAGAQLADAGVADALATAGGQPEAGLPPRRAGRPRAR